MKSEVKSTHQNAHTSSRVCQIFKRNSDQRQRDVSESVHLQNFISRTRRYIIEIRLKFCALPRNFRHIPLPGWGHI